MNETESDPYASLYAALRYVSLASGLYINGTASPQSSSNWSAALSVLPLILGFIGLVFNILALLIFTASKTFRENSFRCYIYAFVFINCASILTHSWFYLIFYLADPIQFCKYLQYLQQSTATTSLWIMILLSLERSFTFSRPFMVKRLLQTRTICIILLTITCFCFGTHIDELISLDVKAFRWVNFAYGLCSFNRHLSYSSIRIKIVTHSHSFILPFILNSILDMYICYQICRRRRRFITKLPILLNNNSNKKVRQRSKKSVANEITLTLLCQSMWLLFTNFPRHLYYFLISFNLIHDYYDRDNSTLSFLMRLNLLIYFAFSPALYVILSPTLRREIRSFICRSYKRHRPTSSSNMSNAQDKFRHFLLNHHYYHHNHQPEQQGNIQSPHLTILITNSEQTSGKNVFESILVPTKSEYLSESTPCLFVYKQKVEYDYSQKIERANTLSE